MPPPGFRVGARRAVSPRAIHVLSLDLVTMDNLMIIPLRVAQRTLCATWRRLKRRMLDKARDTHFALVLSCLGKIIRGLHQYGSCYGQNSPLLKYDLHEPAAAKLAGAGIAICVGPPVSDQVLRFQDHCRSILRRRRQSRSNYPRASPQCLPRPKGLQVRLCGTWYRRSGKWRERPRLNRIELNRSTPAARFTVRHCLLLTFGSVRNATCYPQILPTRQNFPATRLSGTTLLTSGTTQFPVVRYFRVPGWLRSTGRRVS